MCAAILGNDECWKLSTTYTHTHTHHRHTLNTYTHKATEAAWQELSISVIPVSWHVYYHDNNDSMKSSWELQVTTTGNNNNNKTAAHNTRQVWLTTIFTIQTLCSQQQQVSGSPSSADVVDGVAFLSRDRRLLNTRDEIFIWLYQLNQPAPSQTSSMKCITVSHLCGVERKWSSLSVDSVCHSIWMNYYSSALFCAGVKCGLLCKKWWQAISKTVHPLLSLSQGSDQTVLHSSFPNCTFFFSDVSAALAVVPERVTMETRFLE